MHVWVVEFDRGFGDGYEFYGAYQTREQARYYSKLFNYKTRVVKYISTKGE